jgi:hypothetical protein
VLVRQSQGQSHHDPFLNSSYRSARNSRFGRCNNTTTRLARIVHGLLSRPHGWSFDAIQAELSISGRTLLRYLAACRRELVDADGHPILEVIRRGERRLLRLADAARTPESTAYQALSFYFAPSSGSSTAPS